MEYKEKTEASILLVDDEKVIRQSLTRELTKEIFSVTAASSGSDAISAMQAGQYDLVFTDRQSRQTGQEDRGDRRYHAPLSENDRNS